MADLQAWPIFWKQGLLDSKPPLVKEIQMLCLLPASVTLSQHHPVGASEMEPLPQHSLGLLRWIFCLSFGLCMPEQPFRHNRGEWQQLGNESTGCFCWRNCNRKNMCHSSSIALDMAVDLCYLQRKLLPGNPPEISHCASTKQARGSILGPKRRSASRSSNICRGIVSPGLISPLFCPRRNSHPKSLTHLL